jgi:glycosyltransferase involved in cell wall biosynthesis
MDPEVSILLPCFNSARHLSECFESLSHQSLTGFEIIAVDDGSEDATADLLRKAAKDDNRLHLVRQRHAGIAAALMTACEKARAPLLARMDADDVSKPERLEIQARFLGQHPEIGVVGSRVRMFPREGLGDGLLRYEAWVNGLLTHQQMMRDLFVESPLPHPSVMIRREALERVGGYRNVGWPEDYDLWMRMARAGLRFGKVPGELLLWRDWQERASRIDPRFTADSFLSLKEHYLLDSFLAGRNRVALWGAGPVGKGWARRLAGRGLEVTHFIDVDPRKIGKRIHGVPVIPTEELPRLRGTFLLVAVGALSRQPGRTSRSGMPDWTSARDEIRSQLAAADFVDGRDFICVA